MTSAAINTDMQVCRLHTLMLWVYTQEHYTIEFYSWFLRELHIDIIVAVLNDVCTSITHLYHPSVSCILTTFPFVYWRMAILTEERWNLRVVLICIFLMTKDIEHLCMLFVPIKCS